MRNAAVYADLLATTFASLGQAMVNLTILSSVDDVRFDDGILVEWATDQTYVRPLPTSPLSTAEAVTDNTQHRASNSTSSRRKPGAGLLRKTSSTSVSQRLARVISL
jgi:hypothetical protein